MVASIFWILGAVGVMVSAAPYTTLPLFVILTAFGCLTYYYRRANRKVLVLRSTRVGRG